MPRVVGFRFALALRHTTSCEAAVDLGPVKPRERSSLCRRCTVMPVPRFPCRTRRTTSAVCLVPAAGFPPVRRRPRSSSLTKQAFARALRGVAGPAVTAGAASPAHAAGAPAAAGAAGSSGTPGSARPARAPGSAVGSSRPRWTRCVCFTGVEVISAAGDQGAATNAGGNEHESKAHPLHDWSP
jgi:hypothetical protein